MELLFSIRLQLLACLMFLSISVAILLLPSELKVGILDGIWKVRESAS